uniref:Uncharacterized protein n=1 Tax=Ascaris lumbricoides TaxID=6252 RepID=A0A9J2Q7H3_ASCLU
IDPFYEYRKWQIAYLSSTTQASLVINPAYPQRKSVNIPTLDIIEIFGYVHSPLFETAKLNNVPFDLSDCASYNPSMLILRINCTNLIDMSLRKRQTLTWNHNMEPYVPPPSKPLITSTITTLTSFTKSTHQMPISEAHSTTKAYIPTTSSTNSLKCESALTAIYEERPDMKKGQAIY